MSARWSRPTKKSSKSGKSEWCSSSRQKFKDSLKSLLMRKSSITITGSLSRFSRCQNWPPASGPTRVASKNSMTTRRKTSRLSSSSMPKKKRELPVVRADSNLNQVIGSSSKWSPKESRNWSRSLKTTRSRSWSTVSDQMPKAKDETALRLIRAAILRTQKLLRKWSKLALLKRFSLTCRSSRLSKESAVDEAPRWHRQVVALEDLTVDVPPVKRANLPCQAKSLQVTDLVTAALPLARAVVAVS